ncbi:Pentatricopeptide repeat-containing protein [Abeliophyllum distichum]|uniref:Pentatricopeptide repeat-containing protein n=1 Tax=Abeliophyllum distichum TaxID=126358 RepID=A0ABD1VVI7_9LAMI
MSQTQFQAVTLLSKMLKIPPLEALSLFNSSSQQGLHHTQQSITVILHHFLSFDMPSYAQSLIQQVLCGSITSPLYTLSSLLSHLTQDTMNSNCPLVYEAIVNAHVNSQLQPEQALFYFDQMVDKGFVPQSNTLNNVLIFLVRSNRFEKAWCVFDRYKGRIVTDEYTFGILMKGCCDTGDLKRGFQVFDEMCHMGYSPNVVVYTTLIDGCCKNGEVEKAKELFCKMEDLGLVANQYTYTVLINGFFKKGFKREGFKLYEKMKLDGVLPDLYTYNCVMSEYCKDGKMSKAFELFEEMHERGGNITENPSRVLDFVHEMEERGISPSQVTFTILIDAFARSFDMEKAVQVLSCMNKANLVPDVCTYGVLINGWCYQGNMKEASKLFRSMGETNVKPNDVIYNTMICGYCKEGSSYKALKLLQEMCGKRMIPNEASYNMTIKVLCDDEKWEEAQILCTNMIKSGLRLSKILFDITSKAKAINV